MLTLLRLRLTLSYVEKKGTQPLRKMSQMNLQFLLLVPSLRLSLSGQLTWTLMVVMSDTS
jgi:hypothetical protein